MKCMNRNVLYGLGAVAVAIFFLAPSARHYLPVLAGLACPLSMAGMVFGATNLAKKKSPMSCGTAQPASTIPGDSEHHDSLRNADLASLRARIAELEKTPQRTRS